MGIFASSLTFPIAIQEILSTADVCVNPDSPNGMNDISTMIKIMKYMALSKPIVQFDLKEGRYSAQDAALYAQNNNIKDFAEKMVGARCIVPLLDKITPLPCLKARH